MCMRGRTKPVKRSVTHKRIRRSSPFGLRTNQVQVPLQKPRPASPNSQPGASLALAPRAPIAHVDNQTRAPPTYPFLAYSPVKERNKDAQSPAVHGPTGRLAQELHPNRRRPEKVAEPRTRCKWVSVAARRGLGRSAGAVKRVCCRFFVAAVRPPKPPPPPPRKPRIRQAFSAPAGPAATPGRAKPQPPTPHPAPHRRTPRRTAARRPPTAAAHRRHRCPDHRADPCSGPSPTSARSTSTATRCRAPAVRHRGRTPAAPARPADARHGRGRRRPASATPRHHAAGCVATQCRAISTRRVIHTSRRAAT